MGSKPKAPRPQPVPPPPPPPPPPVPVSYKKEETREEVRGGSKKSLGMAYLQRRKATPSGGSGFGGTKQTLG
jgi:hypothetical protein